MPSTLLIQTSTRRKPTRGSHGQAPVTKIGPPTPQGRSDLSAREFDVVELLIDGLTNREIAARLCLSHRTVHAHLSNAMRRTGTRTRTQLAVFALRTGLVQLIPEYSAGVCQPASAPPGAG